MNGRHPDVPLSSAILPEQGDTAGHAQLRLDQDVVAALNLEFQAAVKSNEAETTDRVLYPQYALVPGNGWVIAREKLLEGARSAFRTFQIQDKIPGTQTVRVWGWR